MLKLTFPQNNAQTQGGAECVFIILNKLSTVSNVGDVCTYVGVEPQSTHWAQVPKTHLPDKQLCSNHGLVTVSALLQA